jgi:Cft2 family RNA processing exonuclease
MGVFDRAGFLALACVQFDCGIHPGYSGMAALPYFDEIDPISIDVLLVTQ